MHEWFNPKQLLSGDGRIKSRSRSTIRKLGFFLLV